MMNEHGPFNGEQKGKTPTVCKKNSKKEKKRQGFKPEVKLDSKMRLC
jgi:hypothetical protein